MRENILIITADQLTFRALQAYGGHAQTPNLDRIANGAIRFDRCYTPCPMCQPARSALWCGRYPHETTVISNNGMFREECTNPSFTTIGDVFTQGGYEAVHFGKRHDAGALRGFACTPEKVTDIAGTAALPFTRDTKCDRHTADVASEWLRNRAGTHDKPYIAVVEFINPHNICEWIGANEGVHETLPLPGELPPLPENFAFDDIANRPRAVQYICCSHRRQTQTTGWTPDDFRAYIAAYYAYIAQFDKEMGLVLDALDASGEAENTMILFTADHGDHMAARGMTTKHAAFYEEVMRVPLFLRLPGKAKGGTVDTPVSLLDIFPTLCSYAGLAAPETLRGVDLLALANGAKPNRAYIASEWHTEWGYTVAPGRMICTDSLKYTYYAQDGEELFDLQNDPYEKKNVIADSAYATAAETMRGYLRAFAAETNDDIFTLQPYDAVTTPGWKTHAPGYQNHIGLSAPDQYDVQNGANA